MICNGCDSPATVRLDGAVWCGTHALARLTGIAPAPGDFRPPARHDRGHPLLREAPVLGGGPAGPVRWRRLSPPRSTSPGTSLAEILRAERQWWEVEHDLKVLHGMTLNDLAARLTAELEATA